MDKRTGIGRRFRLIYYSHAETNDTLKILGDVERFRPNKIVMSGETEWEMRPITKEFVSRIKELGTELKVIHGCFISQHHIDYYKSVGLPIENIIFWGTHFFNYIHMHLRHRPMPVVTEYKHKFISLNNRSHIHRCCFIEEMAKQNLLDKGVVTWIAHLNENSDYPYKYFDGNKRLLDDDFINTLDSHTFPKQWYESSFEVITESTPHIQFLTEKTVRNLLYKKPFMILGAPNIHKTLTALGIKLYDEVIDYSFDDTEDLHQRTELFVNNIHTILSYDSNELYEKLRPKIEYNYNRAMDIVTDVSYIPKDFLQGASTHVEESRRLSNYMNVPFKKTKYFNIWDSNQDNTIDYLNKKADLSNHNVVVIDQAVEFAYNMLNSDTSGVDRLITNCQEHNIPVKLLTSTYKYNASQLSKQSDQYELLEIIDTPGYWINAIFNHMMVDSHRQHNLSNGFDLLDKNVCLNENINYLYISMNNLAHPHRCMMMDILAKYDLIDLGKISWRDVIRQFDNDRNTIPDSVRQGYEYQYWTPKRLHLDQNNLSSNARQEVLPVQYRNAFMQLVNESTVNQFFLTEKTATPLLHNKIFLVVGSRSFHSNLVDMGFKLYDSLFDYSFDALTDVRDRIDGVVQNINKYRNMTAEQLTALIKENESIIRHNRMVALDHAFNLVPKKLQLIQATLSGQGVKTRLDTVIDILAYKNAI